MKTVRDWGVTPDLNLLPIAGLRADLAEVETTHLVWEMQEVAGTAGDRVFVLVEEVRVNGEGIVLAAPWTGIA